MSNPNGRPRAAAPDNRRIPGSASQPRPLHSQKPGTPQPLPVQKPIDDDAPQIKETPKWKKALVRVLTVLLVIVLLVFAYLFLLMGEPEEHPQEAAPAATAEPITLPMNALEAPGEANIPSLAETFGEPVLALYGNALPMQRARVYDSAFGGEYARRVTLSYQFSDGMELLLESIRPIDAISLLGGDYRLQADRLYAMAGLDAARMHSDDFICMFAQSDRAVYAILLPTAHEGELEALLKQTLLVSADQPQ
ncbi:MAG: hypothetical protein E7319_07185 [Clostridiales bacterium]|nr:hypothetical protein [Clostridiales bacterium]